jgi:hypothetical protein
LLGGSIARSIRLVDQGRGPEARNKRIILISIIKNLSLILILLRLSGVSGWYKGSL